MLLFLRLIGESFGFAFSALRENRTRTLLSLLGVTIGILIIIGVFSAVDTLRANLESSVEKLGSKTIYVMKWPWDGGPDFPWWKYVNRPEPTLRDYESLKSRMTTAEAISFSIDIGNRTAQYLNNNVSGVTVTATSHELYNIRDLEIVEGRYFTESESNRGSNVAVIGATIAEGLFPNTDPIGKSLKVLGRKITVIGVFKEEGEGMIFDVSMDNVIMIPLNLGRNLINIRRYGPVIMVSAAPNVSLEETESELRGVMRSIHRLGPQQEDDFSLNKTTIITAQLDAMFKVINIAGGIIGAFSILVGGFGIANIMFVSVKERTHIIGIQKSLGAKNYFILSQFLIEAIALCLIGGLMGLSFVFLLTLLVKLIFDLAIVVNVSMVILTVFLSTLIGLIAGIIPAAMAARMDPVEAIRSK
ncbi:ABC transporter permease [Parapedobacter defluvii]|uniref:ABC transporter permease n=1 Tax=Parapedobacter defluvii TaxID=2045106 RepID=A0ABQ1MZ65_9SPHI|nr:ABC transporter permease [Parapedobacter defluvii]GGC47552.1 ABC transporter permease [Parapedobacter defluvii]